MLGQLLVAGALIGSLGSSSSSGAEPPKLVYDAPAGIYAYGPSVIDEGSTRWMWTCHNQDPRVIRDHVYYTKFVGGSIVTDRSVLQASAAGWDSFHTCDPSVVAGSFRYGGHRYGYAMFYLGNDLDASAHNQVGVAFADSLDGPWRKLPDPVVRFDNVAQWGVGQPSVLTLAPGTGRVELFYTQGDTSTRAFHRSVDLSNVDAMVVGEPTELTTAGLTGTDGGADWLNNYDLAYEPRSRRFVVVREQHPYPPEGDNPWWIGRAVQIASIDAQTLLRGEGTWRVEGVISPERTGFARNHNAGLVRTKNGWLPRPDRTTVVFTDSCAGPTCDSLYEYDLWQLDQRLSR